MTFSVSRITFAGIALFTLVLFVLLPAPIADAQCSPVTAPEENMPIAESCTGWRNWGTPEGWVFEPELGVPALSGFSPDNGVQLFGWLYAAALGLSAVLALIMLVIGGVRYVAGAGNAGQQGAAKDTIRNALLGLVLTLAATLILYTINDGLTTIAVPEGVLCDNLPERVDMMAARPDQFLCCINEGNTPSECNAALGNMAP
jgi:hypothetical protein